MGRNHGKKLREEITVVASPPWEAGVFISTHSPAVAPAERFLSRTCWRCCSGHWRPGRHCRADRLSPSAWSCLWTCVRLCVCSNCTGRLFRWWWCSGRADRTRWWAQGFLWPCRRTGRPPSPQCTLTPPGTLEHLKKEEVQWGVSVSV